MPVTLHDVTVGTFVRMLGALAGVLSKGRAHCESGGVRLDDLLETRLIEDMLPLRFQIICVAHHSLGALLGVEEGAFGSPTVNGQDFDDLQAMIAETREDLLEYAPETVDGLAERPVRLGNIRTFTGERFLLSFSLPNFYFHAATAYDILRMRGVPIGKRDFLGRF